MTHSEAFPDYTWSLPTPEVEYNGHEFLGKRKNNITKIILWWDITNVPLRNRLGISFYHWSWIWWDLNNINFSDFVDFRDTIQASIISPNFPWYTLKLTVNNNRTYLSIDLWSGLYPNELFQLGVLNEDTNERIIGSNALVNGIPWIPWTYIEIIVSSVTMNTEIINLSEKNFNITTDKVFYKGNKQTSLLWSYLWWSNPENVQRNSPKVFYPSDWQYSFVFNTNWINNNYNSWQTNTYTNLSQIVKDININLLNLWSVFTLIAIWEDRIIIWDNNWTPLLNWDQYFIDNNYVEINLTIFNPIQSWIIDSFIPWNISLNLTYNSWESMYYGSLPQTGWCPEDIVSFKNHYFVWQTPWTPWKTVLWWDYRDVLWPIYPWVILIWDNNKPNSYANTLSSTNINDFVNEIYDHFNTFVNDFSVSTWVSIIVEAVWDNGIVIYLQWWDNPDNLQFTFNSSTYWYLDWDDEDPDNDWIWWIQPSEFILWATVSWPCEVIENTQDTFKPSEDFVQFIKPEISGTFTGDAIWWSFPELTQWWSVPAFTPWIYEMNLFFETNWIVSWIDLDPTYYNTFRDVIDDINTNFQTNWSVFKVLNSWNNRIVVTDSDLNILNDWDPYFAANNYVTIQIEIFSQNDSAYLVLPFSDGASFTVTDIQFTKQFSWLHYGWMVYPTLGWLKPTVPTPMIRYLKNWYRNSKPPTADGSILFQAYFTEADRWVLDYEPEIYLYFVKVWGWYKNHANKRIRKRIAHMAKTDINGLPISAKLSINPRLKGKSDRSNIHETERWLNWWPKDMKTTFRVKPFQFLWRIYAAINSNGTWSFPIAKLNWNKSWTGTEFPPTFAKTSIWDQNNAPNKERKMIACFKLVIRNPLDPLGYPIESDISNFFIIEPRGDNNLQTLYWNRQVKVNG